MNKDNQISLLDEFFFEREQEVLCEITAEEKEVIEKVRKSGNEEKLNLLLEKIENKELAENLSKVIDLVVDDVMMQLSTNLKKYYQTGFKDAIKLMKECFE